MVCELKQHCQSGVWTATAGLILSCQSGSSGQVWKRQGIIPGDGVNQLWLAMAGQSISCSAVLTSQYSAYNVTFAGAIDISGNPSARIIIEGVSDTGWVSGTYLENRSVSAIWYPTMSLNIAGMTAVQYGDHGSYAPANSNPINSSLQMQNTMCLATWT